MRRTHSTGRWLVTGLLAVLAGLSLSGVAAVADTNSSDGTVTAGIDQVYRPGRLVGGKTSSSVAVTSTGSPLRLQAVPIGYPALEPTIGVTADGTAFMTAADTGTINERLTRPRVVRSTDGGINWADVTNTLPVPLEDDGSTSVPPVTFDPYVYVDPDTGRVFQPELGPLTCSMMNISDDLGETWVTNPVACGMPVNDHQTVAAGPPPMGLELPGYPNVVYYCFSQTVASACGHSLDGGLTFTPAGAPAFDYDPALGGLCDGIHGHITVDNGGRLLMPKGHCAKPWLAVSDDAGLTWRRHLVNADIAADDPHTAVAVDDADNIYYVWWDRTDRLPWLSVSTDHGQTWGDPMMIAPPGVAEVNFPSIAAGAAGRVAIMFPGTTVDDFDDDRRPWHSYHVVSTNALDDDPVFTSTTANPADDPVHRGDCGTADFARCGAMLDFLDILVAPADGDLWSAIVDDCMSACVNGGYGGGYEGVAVRQVGGPQLRP